MPGGGTIFPLREDLPTLGSFPASSRTTLSNDESMFLIDGIIILAEINDTIQ